MNTQSQHIDPRTLEAWTKLNAARVIDVREPDEFAREHLPGAVLIPLSRLDPASFPRTNGRRIVLQCKSGRRAAEARSRLLAGGHSEVYVLSGGIDAWKAQGMPTQVDAKAPALSVMRQVQLVVGLSVLAGSVLTWLVSPWFLLLTGFFGAGLAFAGATGTCALASVLSVMPWNRGVSCVCSAVEAFPSATTASCPPSSIKE